jgi:LacI family transcriptional regulator
MSLNLIAARAGVSIATVSRVMNNSRPVRPEVAEAVRRAIVELQIPPKTSRKRKRPVDGPAARSIAVVAIGQPHREWFAVPVIASVIAEISRAAQQSGLSLLIREMPLSGTENGAAYRYADVAGAVAFISASASPQQLHELNRQLPLVAIMGGTTGPLQLDHVGPDNAAVGHLAATTLIDRGAKNLAFLTLRPDWAFIRTRAFGFFCACAEHDVVGRSYLLADREPHLHSYGPDAVFHADLGALVKQLAQQRPSGPLGLFVPRDEETVIVYRALADAGLTPGVDVQVMSCDNEQVRLSGLSPAPTSIELGTTEIARRALRRLEYRIKHPDDPPTRMLVRPTLVEPRGAFTGFGDR